MGNAVLNALCLLSCLLASLNVTEVKNLGVSAANDANSILQLSWQAQPAPDMTLQSFDLELAVTYADGYTQSFQASVNGLERRRRFEVPTLHFVPKRPPAEMKRYKATVTARYAELTETATKQGDF